MEAWLTRLLQSSALCSFTFSGQPKNTTASDTISTVVGNQVSDVNSCGMKVEVSAAFNDDM